MSVILLTLLTAETSGECRNPRLTYIPWQRVRRYVTKYHDITISPFSTGDSLSVLRCGRCFDLCNNDQCGIKSQEFVSKILKFNCTMGDGELLVTHLEDTECHCVSEESYKDSCAVKKIPPIISAEAKRLL